MWDDCGMERSEASLKRALAEIPRIREEFWRNVAISGGDDMNPTLERACRVADFLEFAELLCHDALHRNESCGGHFRSEYQDDKGEAKRDDKNFCYAAGWEFTGVGNMPTLHKEPLHFEEMHLTRRNYE